MMMTRTYHPLAQVPGALPVTVTVAINFVQFDVRNPDISLRARLIECVSSPLPLEGLLCAR
jgi:hypothetical protein